jgi:hypothetical protein
VERIGYVYHSVRLLSSAVVHVFLSGHLVALQLNIPAAILGQFSPHTTLQGKG